MNKILTAVAAVAVAGLFFMGLNASAADVWKLQLKNADAGVASGTIDPQSQYKIICANPGCYKTGASGATMTDLDCTKNFPVGQNVSMPLNIVQFASATDQQVATRGISDAGAVTAQSCNVYKVTVQ